MPYLVFVEKISTTSTPELMGYKFVLILLKTLDNGYGF